MAWRGRGALAWVDQEHGHSHAWEHMGGDAAIEQAAQTAAAMCGHHDQVRGRKDAIATG